MPRGLVEHARGVARELLADAPQARLLHGDLHHDNVLRASREPFLAIDPHGVVGDPAYDTGAWLYNPAPDIRDDALVALVPARVEQLADGLALPVDRVLAWGFVQAVLSASWTCDTREAPDDRALDVAALLAPRLP
jgi:streptomycin 6-kinase